jgi:hypothetical protein
VIHEKIGKESIDCADILCCIGAVYGNQEKAKEELEYYLKAEAIHEKVGKESRKWANTLFNIGVVYDKQDKVK